ncbi:MAG: ATP-binding cassette domain-containing protein [Hyphomicrobiaceae bacterium]
MTGAAGAVADQQRSADGAKTGRLLLAGHGLSVVRDGRRILDGIDIALHADEVVTLIGPNGAGKSTLVRVLLGLVSPDEGYVEKSPGLVVGYVPQRLALERTIPLTVARFLTLGVRRSADRVAAALDEVGAGHLAARQIHALSGGELQRVALARALLREPQLIVLDEPATGVDYVGEVALYALIERLRGARGLAVLMVSHDLHVVMAKSDRVLCINGHICCSGKPSAVAHDPAYRALFGEEGARAVAIYSHHHDHRHDGCEHRESGPGNAPQHHHHHHHDDADGPAGRARPHDS